MEDSDVFVSHEMAFNNQDPYRWNTDNDSWEYWSDIDAAWFKSEVYKNWSKLDGGNAIRKSFHKSPIALYDYTWAEPISEIN